ncbi:BolA family transcriptional regulator [Hydrogenophaga sp.]|uniref:BolA family protein n=1 Tax=Hydrogenophaga sp. TaxID=1904254 RepID=UPI00271BF22B|nr:BolA family protein [Hydrogenophaga sp.]MDO8904602.1 BolA family protein [Hydrogenophaga sp.]
MIPTPLPADSVPTAEAIHTTLQSALSPVLLEVLDESAAHAGHAGANGLGRGTHFRVRIGGPAFAGKSRVAQHRLVYDALRKFTAAGLHALAIEIKS